MTWEIDRWPLDEMVVSSPFGWRRDPVDDSAEAEVFHNGVDLAAPMYEELFPVAPCTVENVAEDNVSGLWIAYVDDHGHRYAYAHCSATLALKGDRVMPTMPIALVGSTGKSTGPHLHWTARVVGGKNIDPLTLRVRDGGSGALVALAAAAALIPFAMGDGADDGGGLYVDASHVDARIADLQRAESALNSLAVSLWNDETRMAVWQLAELVKRVRKTDVPWLVAQGKVDAAYNLATNTLAAANDVLRVEGDYTLAAGVISIVDDSVREIGANLDAARPSLFAAALVVAGVLALTILR